jgi:hypothetical protein
VTVGDAQKIGRSLIGLPISQPQFCPAIGGYVQFLNLSLVWGDADCNGGVGIGDAQKIARKLIGLPFTQTQPCPQISSQ